MTITAPLLQKRRRNKKSSPYPRMSTVNSPYSRRHGDEHSLQRKGARITDLNREGVLVLAFRMNGRNYSLNEHKDVYQHLGAVAQSIPSWCSCSTSFSCCFACSPPSSCRQGGDYWKRLRCFPVMRWQRLHYLWYQCGITTVGRLIIRNSTCTYSLYRFWRDHLPLSSPWMKQCDSVLSLPYHTL